MRRIHESVFITFLAIASPSAADLATELAKCAAVTDSLQRLTCYDTLARNAVAPGGAAGATTRSSATSSEPRRAPVSERCQATTQKGAQCKRNAKPGSSYCWQHGR